MTNNDFEKFYTFRLIMYVVEKKRLKNFMLLIMLVIVARVCQELHSFPRKGELSALSVFSTPHILAIMQERSRLYL